MKKTLLLVVGLLFALASPAAAADVSFDRPGVAMAVGERVTLSSKVTNPGAEPSGQVLAHLNVVSLTDGVYVDPEDWSSERSQVIENIGPGESQTLSWPIQAVNVGSFAVYVVLLPDAKSTAGRGPLVVSPPVHLDVAGKQTLNAGGALPVVLVVPVLLGLGAGAVRYRHARNR
ncbi:hypothetical protein DMA12_07150 [Amycolatopsis balhimycina DSM 5908]|uniref:DUF916 domain-containing protein n=1 Tax=Amycolatopsis balhimycina DSM 5908 TaxID=1081091 RepID=A0A428WZ11_AMYBA|nr:hypothetical protein [Amycolatopsis balhimycina]RSM48257.1 hypothetical protein DMA12_07150 [Amycolatopsis balhimycina DSM 5908]